MNRKSRRHTDRKIAKATEALGWWLVAISGFSLFAGAFVLVSVTH